MSNLQSSSEMSRPNVVADEFEEGWDCGVDWANERAEYRSLRLVKQLHSQRCSQLDVLIDTLGCKPVDLFGPDAAISERRVEGFIDGAVAILHEGRV